MAVAMELDDSLDTADKKFGKAGETPELKKKKKRKTPKKDKFNNNGDKGVEAMDQGESELKSESEWNLRTVSGLDLVSKSTSVTRDGKHVLVNSGDKILVYSASSGQLVRSRNTGETLCATVGENEGEVYFASKKKICLWNFITVKVLKQFKIFGNNSKKEIISSDILDIVIPPKFNSHSNIFVTVKQSTKNALYRVNVENHIFNRIFKDIKLGSVHVGENDNSVCAISSPKEDGYKDATLVVYDQNLSKVFSINTDKERPFTVARVHPLERTVACGDTSGRILVYSGLQQAEPAKSILHWHNLPLTGLDWSEEGSVLYSGGGEAVMCKWRREDGSKPQFVPRVGAPIVRLGGGGNLTVMQLQNNSLVLMDRQEDTVKGVVGGLCKSETGWPAGIAVDRDRLVMNGCVGKLQVFSTRNNNVHSLDITGQNYLTKERGATPHNSEVERVAVSQCGLYLATVDCLWSTLPRVTLRLWSYDPTINNFSLNTQVDSPHTEKDTSAVVELRFQPTSTTHLASSPLLLSVGTDCRGKLWSRDTSTWTCSSSIQLRGLPATCGAWSGDGTILGIAFSHLVTLWDTDTRLRTTLSLDGSSETISSLAFGCGAQARLVFSVTSSKLVSWDLLNLSPAWTLPLDSSPYTRLFPCPTSSLVALVQKDCVILVSSQTGEVIHKLEETNSSGGAAWVQDIKSVSGSALYFLTYSGQLQRLGSHYITSSHQTPLQSVPSHLGSLLSAKGGTADNKTVIATKQWTTARQEDDIEAVLSLPLHALPPPSQLKMTLVRNRLLALPKLRSVKSNRFDLEAKTDVVTRKKIEKFNAAFKFELDTPEQMNLKSFCKLLKSTKLENE